ncbi:unnamed protein product [Schistocephalus solidus]|uniref:Apple domain-containing protein n=1 Tax=Schistocephalus solidus TaxID=70667 RepID=A0A183TJY0_SCHSO|nr:unnamed protein product [Schistocephalus solidus]
MTVQMIEMGTGEDFPGDFVQRYAWVIITELSVLLPLVELDDGRVFEILRNFSLAPHALEECFEFCHQPGPTVLVDCRWNCVGSRASTGALRLCQSNAREIPHGHFNLAERLHHKSHCESRKLAFYPLPPDCSFASTFESPKPTVSVA